MNKIAIKMIKAYQEKISSQTNPKCRHTPTCSQYGLIAYKRFNFFKASFLTAKRILSCNPLFKPKYDPVPEKVLKPNDNFIFACIAKSDLSETIVAYDFKSFIDLTYKFDLVPEPLEIICLDKTKVTYTLNNNGYILNKSDAIKNATDILNYESFSDGRYKLNKAFKKINTSYTKCNEPQ
ncbi:conserved hypothetical protein [Alteracholeplasma palmae J233]|uniref:Putative membrane protein insertion efficiency factor n=1 Tax=Alteracholeplasma palmae (strain ATCC 49389 / J233) TaxID=1318466 RepID=U4KRB5_ALTPJ|nr:membrane protein insertion efficiency factor YidD [Alteracholeplasma palmae]CCV64016.1 conserved hypothetical protein [Alteracholeplasma palmae J233]